MPVPATVLLLGCISLILVLANTQTMTMELLTTEDYNKLPHVPPDQKYTYGTEHASQFGELYLPQAGAGSGPLPVVVVIHGGCYLEEYPLGPLAASSAALRDMGFAVWNIEYRRLHGGGGWPAMFLDIAHAVDYVRVLAPMHNLDLDNVTVTGHSAGGHFALWVAARHNLPKGCELYVENPLRVKSVVALAPIPDLAAGMEGKVCDESIGLLMGGTAADHPDRFAQGSPVSLLPLGLSGAHHVVVHGLQDPWVPPKLSADWVQSAAKAGESVHMVTIDGAGHYELVAPTHPLWLSQVKPCFAALLP